MIQNQKSIFHSKEFSMLLLGLIAVIVVGAYALMIYSENGKLVNKLFPENEGVRILKNASTTDSIYKIYKEDGTFIPLSGKRWESSTTTTKLLSNAEVGEFPNGYNKQLLSDGWQRDIVSVSGKNFYAPVGRGNNGVMWGYFKVHNNYLYTVSMEQYFNASEYGTSTNGSTTVRGPYTYTYRIFSADPVPLKRLK